MAVVARLSLRVVGMMALGMLLMQPVGAEDLYKYRDPQTGRLIISNQPPPEGAQVERQMQAVTPSASTTSLPPGGAPTPASVAPGGSASGIMSIDTEQILKGGHNETWWRAQARELRSAVQATTDKLVAAMRYYNSLPSTAQGILGVPVVQAWHNAEAEIARLKAQLSIDRRALETFEEDARKADVFPGWLREK